MKRILVCVLVALLFCLGLAPVLAGGLAPAPIGAPYAAASSPVAKSSLAPFVHLRSSNVTNLSNGIGYVDSVVTIDGGVLAGAYANTTELQYVMYSNYWLSYISVYGTSQITINNTNMSSASLLVYGSSRVTLINSTFSKVCVNGSSVVVLRNRSNAAINAFDTSEVNITNSTVPNLLAYNSSRVYVSESSQISNVQLSYNSYLEVDNSTIDKFQAGGFATCQITNGSAVTTFGGFDAANVSVIDSSISGTLEYGLVCTTGSLNISGSTITGLENCRNTTTLIGGSHPPTMNLTSVSALASSSVKIANNGSIRQVYAHDSSTVNLENASAYIISEFSWDYQIITCTDYSTIVVKNSQPPYCLRALCYGHSNLTLQNITFGEGWVDIFQFDWSSITIKNCSHSFGDLGPTVKHYLYGQSRTNIENLNLTGMNSFFYLRSYDSSVVDIKNVNVTVTLLGLQVYSFDSSVVNIVNATLIPFLQYTYNIFCSYDLSVMTIDRSNITVLGYAVKSNGDMSVTSGVLGGSYINTTTVTNSLNSNYTSMVSVAVVGTDTATITGSDLNASIYLHNKATLNIQDSILKGYWLESSVLCMYDSSKASATNTTFQNITMFKQSSANLSNITAKSTVSVYDSATMICNGSASAPSTLKEIRVTSDYPLMANVVINSCAADRITGDTWIMEFPLPFPLLSYLAAILGAYLQGLLPTSTLLLIGGGLFAIIAAIVGITFWKRRP